MDILSNNNSLKLADKLVRKTPMLQQYLDLKKQVPDCILFFRMGDFYEMFFEDAIEASQILSIVLTSRDKNKKDSVPMCGVPFHAVNGYLAKLIKAGFKVAISEQVEDCKIEKNLVKREITRIVTPGMFIDPQHLPDKEHNYLVSVYLGSKFYGLSYLDLASGEFRATTLPHGPFLSFELARLEPAELVLVEEQQRDLFLKGVISAIDLFCSVYPTRLPNYKDIPKILKGRIPKKVSIQDKPALIAAAMVWNVVLSTQRREPKHIRNIEFYEISTHLLLDASARRNLELFRSIITGTSQGSLLQVIDHTETSMGGRLLRDWLGFPLFNLSKIKERHNAIEELVKNPYLLSIIKKKLAKIPDILRLFGRACLYQSSPHDLVMLRNSMSYLPDIKNSVQGLTSILFKKINKYLFGYKEIEEILVRWLARNPSNSISDGMVIANGIDLELDKLRHLTSSGKKWIVTLQAKLKSELGIPSLKIGFNKVFGYYIEITNTHKNKIPNNFVRRQTISGAERYITSELKEYESAVLEAQDKAIRLERVLFEKLREKIIASSLGLLAAAQAVSILDVIAGLADLALTKNYVRPNMVEEGEIKIIQGRHPVVEQMMKPGEFVANDVCLGGDYGQVFVITGPNMAGKSTILRQVALIVLLAQVGSFVPATEAQIPLVDRIFTRVGAMDDLAQGRSTFMVEMSETSIILQQATLRSLIILDEVGRGTSTFDGLSLAWAIVEHLHNFKRIGVKTLFATHFHELIGLASVHSRIRNFNVSAKQEKGELILLRQLLPGGVSKSYGLDVARFAGLPKSVLKRASQILKELERNAKLRESVILKRQRYLDYLNTQMELFSQDNNSEVLAYLRKIDLSKISPEEALILLSELQHKVS